jgi:hypothetical protein
VGEAAGEGASEEEGVETAAEATLAFNPAGTAPATAALDVGEAACVGSIATSTSRVPRGEFAVPSNRDSIAGGSKPVSTGPGWVTTVLLGTIGCGAGFIDSFADD